MIHDELERILCDDGMCTGIVGLDGRCGTCGRICEAAPLRVYGFDRAVERTAPERDEAGVESASTEAPAERATVDDAEREPCPDGMCTGILGADRRCGTCGAVG